MSLSGKNRKQLIIDFCEFCYNELGLENKPTIIIKNNRDGLKTFANFSFDKSSNYKPKIMVYGRSRMLGDIMRSLAHELVHHHQKLNGDELNGEDGSEIENEANARAGVIMRKFGRENPEIFE